jgi:hypothetical protein
MRHKATKLGGKGYFYNKDSRILNIYDNGKHQYYEFVPLGWFKAERPKAPDVILIDMTCYDQMQKFDIDIPKAADMGVSYPTTISNLYVKLCNYVHVWYRSDSFINSTATVKKAPQDFDNATCRELLKWIAEAAGANARFDRDGYLVLDWLKETGQTYTASGYSEFNPYWYTTKQITKLQNRDTQNAKDIMTGSGDEVYLIQDNPLLRGVS